MKIYYILDDDHKRVHLHNEGLSVSFESNIYDIFPISDGRLLVIAGMKIYVMDSNGITEEIFDGVFEITAYNPQGLLSLMGVDKRSYLLNTSTLTLTDVTIVEGENHEPSMTDVTDKVIVSNYYPFPEGTIRGKGWKIETKRTFKENRWFPPYVFLLSKKDIVALDTGTEEYITLLEKDASNSFMYDSYIHYDDNTLVLLGLTANGNPIVRQYSNIPYAKYFVDGAIVTPNHYVFIQKEKGKYEYYNLKEPSIVRTVQFPGKTWRIAIVEGDNSNIEKMLGGGILASLISNYL